MPTATCDPCTPDLFRGVQAVVFDVVGTLIEPSPSVARAYAEAGRRHGLELAEADIRQRFATAWGRQEAVDAASQPAFATSRRREYDRWRLIVDEVFDAKPEAAAIFQDLWDHFGQPAAWQPVAAGVNLLQQARAVGCEVAVASNFDERLVPLARVLEPLTGIDHVFASSELGWRKPAAAFFRTVESRLGRSPRELLLVGDDPRLDLAAARAVGWRAVGVG